jgi:hypothetical protein
VEDNFMGYKITTSDDTFDFLANPNVEEEKKKVVEEEKKKQEMEESGKIKLQKLKKTLNDLYDVYSDENADLVIKTCAEIHELEGYITNGFPDEVSVDDKVCVEVLPDDKFTCISFLISNMQACCEQFGVSVICPENKDVQSLVGATIKNIKYSKVDTAHKIKVEHRISFDDINDTDTRIIDLDSREICMVDLDTTNGTFKFVMYNSHNGYYRHWYYFSYNNFYDTDTL